MVLHSFFYHCNKVNRLLKAFTSYTHIHTHSQQLSQLLASLLRPSTLRERKGKEESKEWREKGRKMEGGLNAMREKTHLSGNTSARSPHTTEKRPSTDEGGRLSSRRARHKRVTFRNTKRSFKSDVRKHKKVNFSSRGGPREALLCRACPWMRPRICENVTALHVCTGVCVLLMN